MVFLQVEALTPCLTQRLSVEDREKWKEWYCFTKKYCIRTGVGAVSGTGFYTLLKD